MGAITALLVEDALEIRRFLRVSLEAEGFTVVEAGSGEQGLAAARQCSPGLVLLDLGLPDMDGVDLIGQLRTWSSVPVIILSARSSERQKVSALDAGADDYLTKPFGNAELMARIRVLLRRQPGAERQAGAAPLGFGAVSVDLSARLVQRDGEPVHLTPIELKLLSVMLLNAGKVLTHTFLLREVWGSGYAERSHYLRVHMGHLRHKLEDDPARPVHLVTETGVGYRLLP